MLSCDPLLGELLHYTILPIYFFILFQVLVDYYILRHHLMLPIWKRWNRTSLCVLSCISTYCGWYIDDVFIVLPGHSVVHFFSWINAICDHNPMGLLCCWNSGSGSTVNFTEVPKGDLPVRTGGLSSQVAISCACTSTASDATPESRWWVESSKDREGTG